MMNRKHVAALVAFGLALPGVTRAQDAPVEEQIVNQMNKVFGVHAGFRANHAKGVVAEGKFKASTEASGLSKAVLFGGTEVPVTVRFSDSTGVPNLPDGSDDANPHGMAVKFHLPDGSDTNIVTHSYNGFPTATADEFQIALAASGPDAPKPTPLEKFFETHPIAKTFLTAEKPAPVSFGTLPYFGVNSFKFTDAKGDVTYVRYRLEPEAGAQYLTKDQLAAAGPNYLVEEIGKRVGDGPVRFKYIAQVAEEGDKIDDPSIAWPDSRKTVELGVIEIDKVDADSATAERALIFQPTAVPAGIEPADPMISARSAAYAVSFGRRHATAPQ
jgi:catalase